MTVSVLIPCYDEPIDRIERTWRSAYHAAQVAEEIPEIILVDDGSARPVASVFSPFVSIYRQEHLGIAPALQRALKMAHGDYVCWLSVGDVWHRDKLAIQLEHHAATGSLASFHDYYSPGPSGPAEYPGDVITKPGWESGTFGDNQWCGCTTMVDRARLLSIGGFIDSMVCGGCPRECSKWLLYAVDWDFHQRVQLELGWTYIPQVLGEMSEFVGGHSDRARNNAELWAIKDACSTRVSTLGRERQRLWVDKRNRERAMMEVGDGR